MINRIFTSLSILSVIIFIVFCGLASCGDDTLTKNGNSTIRIISPDILQTDEFGIVLGGDSTDWCFNNSTLFRFLPAFPNPADDTAKLVFQLPENDTLSIKYLSSVGDTLTLFSNNVFNPGFYQVQISASNLNLHGSVTRFIIISKRFPAGSDYCRYYGDVQFY